MQLWWHFLSGEFCNPTYKGFDASPAKCQNGFLQPEISLCVVKCGNPTEELLYGHLHGLTDAPLVNLPVGTQIKKFLSWSHQESTHDTSQQKCGDELASQQKV